MGNRASKNEAKSQSQPQQQPATNVVVQQPYGPYFTTMMPMGYPIRPQAMSVSFDSALSVSTILGPWLALHSWYSKMVKATQIAAYGHSYAVAAVADAVVESAAVVRDIMILYSLHNANFV